MTEAMESCVDEVMVQTNPTFSQALLNAFTPLNNLIAILLSLLTRSRKFLTVIGFDYDRVNYVLRRGKNSSQFSAKRRIYQIRSFSEIDTVTIAQRRGGQTPV